ncbi:phosphoglycerate mutase family protein [Patescibacteria group bacterium]|nr:phosphoglycerate mutase family protein [Patescibacteria group bacterium]
MKRVYFIRHGESEGNAGPLRRGADAPLTERGRNQVLSVVSRLATLPVETIIISSTDVRAKETAEIIQDALHKNVTVSELFVERRRPSEVFGQLKNSPISRRVGDAIRINFHIPGYRFSDEENFDDLKNRAHKALTFLSEQSESSLICVTHGFFIRILIAYALHSETLTSEICEHLIRALNMENAGITILDYNEEDTSWKLLTWNDHSHLSESV